MDVGMMGRERGRGLSEDQKYQLAVLERDGHLSDFDRGVVGALRLYANPSEAARIDRLTGRLTGGTAPAPKPKGKPGDRGGLLDSLERRCPTCGRRPAEIRP